MDKKGTFLFNSMIRNMRRWHERGEDDTVIEYLFWLIDYDNNATPYCGTNPHIEDTAESDMVAIDNANKRKASSRDAGSAKYNKELDAKIFEAVETYTFRTKAALYKFLGCSESTGREHLRRLGIEDSTFIDRNLSSEYAKNTSVEGTGNYLGSTVNQVADSAGSAETDEFNDKNR